MNWKRTVACLLATGLVAVASPGFCAELSLHPAPGSVPPGAGLTVELRVNEADGVAAAAFTLEYPSHLLELDAPAVTSSFFGDLTDPDAAQGSSAWVANTDEPGRVRLAGASIDPDPQTGGGAPYVGPRALFTVHFRARGDAPEQTASVRLVETRLCSGPAGSHADLEGDGVCAAGELPQSVAVLMGAHGMGTPEWDTPSRDDDFFVVLAEMGVPPAAEFTIQRASDPFEPTATFVSFSTLQNRTSLGAAPTIVFPSGAVQVYAGLEVLTEPAHGYAAVEDNRLVYTPDADFVGVDGFTYRAIVDAANDVSISGAAAVTVLEGVTVDQPVSRLEAGGQGTFAVTGGSGTYSAGVVSAPAGAGAATLAAGADGAFTFGAPGTGAFAGTYAVEVVDEASGLATTVTFAVPLQITTTAVNILESDTTQSVTVSGGAAGDRFAFSVLPEADGAGGEGAAARVNTPAEASNDTAGGNPAVAAITPADVDGFTAFSIEAADETQAGLAAVRSATLTVVPVVAYSGVVVDAQGQPIAGARVEALGVRQADGTPYAATSGEAGDFALTLPLLYAGEHSFVASAEGRLATVFVGADYAGLDNPTTLTLWSSQGNLAGSVFGLAGGDVAEVYVEYASDAGQQSFGPVFVTGAGAGEDPFAVALPDPALTYARLVATATGYASGVNDNGGAGFSVAGGDVAGADLTLVALVVDREGLENPTAPGGTVLLDPQRLWLGFRVRFGDADDPAEIEAEVTVEVAVDGIERAGIDLETASLGVRTVVLSDPTRASGSGGTLVEVNLDLRDRSGERLPTSGPDSVLRMLRITVPFDLAAVPVGALESGAWVIYGAEHAEDFLAGVRTEISPDRIVRVDYLAGRVTFEVTQLGVFGVDEKLAAPPPASSGGGGGGGGCFVRSLVPL